MSTVKAAWNENQPIYRQLVDVLVGGILDRTYPEGELLPSVRQLATEYGVNPLTAAKAYQELDRFELTEKRRGIGFVVKNGVREVLLRRQQKKFLKDEWPQIADRIQRLELSVEELLEAVEMP